MTTIGPVTGLAVLGTAAAFPRDLCPDAPELDNHGVYRFLMGDDYRSLLERQGRDPDHPEHSWGLKLRQWSSPPGGGQNWTGVVQMATEAGRRALAASGTEPEEVDLLVLATSTPQRITTSHAALVARALGTTGASIDLRAGGAGGLYAMTTAAMYMNCGLGKALVLAAEAGVRYLDPQDQAAALVYADGAGAVLMGPGPEGSGLLGAVMGTTHPSGRAFTVPGPLPPTEQALRSGAYMFHSPDAEYLSELSRQWDSTAQNMKSSFPRLIRQVDHFVPYAVTLPQVRRAARALGVPPERTVADTAAHGCVGSAGPLVSLHDLHRAKRLETGQILALSAVGGGILWAGLLWRW